MESKIVRLYDDHVKRKTGSRFDECETHAMLLY